MDHSFYDQSAGHAVRGKFYRRLIEIAAYIVFAKYCDSATLPDFLVVLSDPKVPLLDQ
jgi:hypothetical protein